MRDLIGREYMTQPPGQKGLQMKLTLKMHKRTMTMVDTILKNNLPHGLNVRYDTNAVCNIQ